MPRRASLVLFAATIAGCGGANDVVDQGGGVLRDRGTGLDWTQVDNGADIEWSDARAWCAARGPGWRLATSDELGALYEPAGGRSVSCGTYDGQPMTCYVSPLFRLSGPTPWTLSEGEPRPLIFGLSPRRKGPGPIDGVDGARALCVREP